MFGPNLTLCGRGIYRFIARPRKRRRVPYVQQMCAGECGAACMAMILGYYGRKTMVAEIRDLCGTGREGTTASTLVEVGRKFGLIVNSYSMEPESISNLKLPAIIHWNFNHYVVLEEWLDSEAHIVDPCCGRMVVSPSDFDRSFTGIILIFTPGPDFQTVGVSSTSPSKSYINRISETPKLWIFLSQILLASLLLQLAGLASPLLMKDLIDYVIPRHAVNTLSLVFVSVCLAIMSQSILAYLRTQLLIQLRVRIDLHVMYGFVEHMLSLPLSFFQSRTSGDLLNRVGSNAILREMVATQTVSAVLDGLFLLVYLAILLIELPPLGLIMATFAGLEVVVVLCTQSRLAELVRSELEARTQEQSYLVEVVRGIRMLKASASEAYALRRWSNIFATQLNIGVERNALSAKIESTFMFLHWMCPAVLLSVGTLIILRRDVQTGTVFGCTALASAMLDPISKLIASAQQLQMASAHIERVSDVLGVAHERYQGGESEFGRLQGSIEMRNVSFGYSAKSRLILQNISCKIESGQKVVIAGATGSGKSTFAMLLLGLFAPTDGVILYDDLVLSRYNLQSLRKQLGVVLQDPVIFQGSIRSNIAAHNPLMSDSDIICAAKIACLHDEIMDMAMGYETVIAEGGGDLSGGQRQRLTIARALGTKPAILLLDEATSNLDEATERSIDDNLSHLHCTRIIITHRKSCISDADQILVLKDGMLIGGSSKNKDVTMVT